MHALHFTVFPVTIAFQMHICLKYCTVGNNIAMPSLHFKVDCIQSQHKVSIFFVLNANPHALFFRKDVKRCENNVIEVLFFILAHILHVTMEK